MCNTYWSHVGVVDLIPFTCDVISIMIYIIFMLEHIFHQELCYEMISIDIYITLMLVCNFHYKLTSVMIYIIYIT